MNRRGSAALAALALTAVVGAAALQMAASVRAAERRSSEGLEETAARARILVRAIDESAHFPDDDAPRVGDYLEKVGDSSLRVKVAWRRAGGRWRVMSWTEVRTWPQE